MLQAQTELRYLKGMGPRHAAALAEAGFATAEDLLYHLPFRYEDRSAFARIADLRPRGAQVTLDVEVRSSRLIRTRRRGFTIFEAILQDSSGVIRGVWYNQPYLARPLAAGRHVVLYAGASIDRRGQLVLENPECEFLDEGDDEGIHTGRIVPVYRRLGDFSSRRLRRLIFQVVSELEPHALAAIVPPEIAERHDLFDRQDALRNTHFPPAGTDLAALERRRTPAQQSLAFEEIFVLQLALALRRHGRERETRGVVYEISDALRTKLAGMLPFQLTEAQKRVLREIGADLRSLHPMQRLLQGDVGSGKTIVALLALLVAVENGFQGALMAPTEILAEQHYRNVRRLIDGGEIDCRIGILTGSQGVAVRRRMLEDIRQGYVQVVIGTHALFEAGVAFRRLGLVVVDEQHRFGVAQRAALAAKGERPDVLVMTATPIPRSLALTLYGDLDLSVIDELPPGRTPIQTVVRRESERERVYDGVRREVGGGRQAYFVVPLVEETEKSDLKAATAFAEELRRQLAPLRVGMVHGRMKGPEKDEVMRAFTAGEIQVLVATTVIEVGVDVPNATVMVIEHAERFGLSQLHQLRGRVGRGSEKSYCILMIGEGGAGPEAYERLHVLERTGDGFLIAQRDLELRGPGAVFGTQQHGLSDLQFLAVILESAELVERARREAQGLVAGEAGEAEAERILAALGGRWRRRLELASVG